MRYHLGTHIIRLESRPSGQFNHKFSLGGEVFCALSRGCYPRAERCCRAMRRMRSGGAQALRELTAILECRPRDKTHFLARKLLLHTKRKELTHSLALRLFAFNLAKKFKEGKQTLLAGCCWGWVLLAVLLDLWHWYKKHFALSAGVWSKFS